MAKRSQHLDHLFAEWPYEFGEVAGRKVKGHDGREVLQMRIDMGVLQMETSGRPDGLQPHGFDTYYDYLLSLAFEEGSKFRLNERRCMEIDREFVQYYHRRICWLALKEFRPAVADADHTLALMDFSSAHAPHEEWADLHEQYRPFVLFHRTQAEALAELEDLSPELAVTAIDTGLQRIHQVFLRQEVEEEYEDDELVLKLREMRDALTQHYEIEPPLTQQLADAIAHEQYERAAELRDRIARRTHGKM